jgi:hypothetical protein
MTRARRIVAATLVAATLGLGATACNDDDADVASHNVSKAADNFEVNRRIVLINTISDKYLLEVVGACSIKVDVEESQLEVICKTSKTSYIKDFFGLSRNVTYTVEQGAPVKASAYHYRKTFKPQSILPDIDFRGSTDDGPRNQG